MKIIIVGCGRVGSGLAHNLSQNGHQISMIDKDAATFENLNASFSGKRIEGIGFDRDVLLRAGVERADGLAAVTNSDEANIVTAQLARQVFRVPKVVARVYDPRQSEIYLRLGLQVVATTSWSVNRIVEILSYSQLAPVLNLGNGEVDIVQSDLPPLLVGRAVHDLIIPGDVAVIAITRRGKVFIPTSGTVFETGDQLHLTVAARAMSRLDAMLQPS